MKERRRIVQTSNWRRVRIICVLALVVSVGAPFPFLETIGSAFSEVCRAGKQRLLDQLNPQEQLPPRPQRTHAERIKLPAGATRELIWGEPVRSAIIIDPDVATIAVASDRVVITGVRLGTTILIISGGSKRTTYAIDVEPAPVVQHVQTDQERRAEHPESLSGFSSLYFVPGLNGGPSVLRHSFEYRQKLGGGRTLRMSSDIFRFFGGGDRALTVPLGSRFGSNRLTLGMDSSTSRIDILDNELEISRLGFNGYSIRGLHFVSTAKSRWRGLEIFAGKARTQLNPFDQGAGRLAGAIVPLVDSPFLRIRLGAFFISSSHQMPGPGAGSQRGGVVIQTDVHYSPDARTKVEGEAAYSNGGLSWRIRLDLQRGAFKFYGETSRLDRRSPMIAIGAQSMGRSTAAFNLQWQPNARFNAVVGYDRTTTSAPSFGSDRLRLNSRTFFVSANFSPTANARLGVAYNQQSIDAPASRLVPFLLNLQTRTAVLNYDQRLNSRLTNSLEARLILSREANTEAQMNRGLDIREQLRYAWRRGYVSAFVNYRSNTPSLESLILHNPGLLPSQYRAAFVLDPQAFLLANRSALPLLLNGIQLPLTHSQEAGVRMQTALSRLDVSGEVIYSVDRFMGSDQRSLRTTLSSNLRIDAANTVQVSASRTFGFSGRGSNTGFTAGYTHRFGAGSGGGFQFSRLLGTGRGHIQGRVFLDLNGNGFEDQGEKGLAGMRVQLDGGKSVTSDSQGDFNFGSLEPGEFDVALLSDEIGVTVRASKATLQHVSLAPHQTINLSFGLTNGSFAAGRIFNDLFLTGERIAGEAPGLRGVILTLRRAAGDGLTRSASNLLTQVADGDGRYEFRNLSPGKYILEIDPATLPENFRLPSVMSWPITVIPLQGLYLDFPFAAQRAVSGFVYLDKDGDGQFNAGKDAVVEGARVVAGNVTAVSTVQGSYLLRNLPAGKIDIQIYFHGRKAITSRRLEFGSEPSLKSGVNLRLEE